METRYYNVEEQTKYMITLDMIDGPEDALDEFMTSDELEQLGVSGWGQTRYFKPAIIAGMQEVLSTVKPGKKSAIITDVELLDCLKHTSQPASHYIDNTRRVGNRLFKPSVKKVKEQAGPTYTDWTKLVRMLEWKCWYDSRISFDFNLTSTDRVKTVEMLKKIFTWEEVEKHVADNNHKFGDHLKWFKMMWEDTTTIPLKKGSN